MDDKVRFISKVPIDIGGVEVHVVDDERAEEAAYVVCVLAGQECDVYKADNIHTECFFCGSEIVHRPHAPKRPPKVCMDCAAVAVSRGEEC